MHGGWGDSEVTPDVRFCGWATVEFGVVVNEGEVLALSFCVFGHLY